MAMIYANVDGTVMFHSGLPFSVPIPPPEEAVRALEFDEMANPLVVQMVHLRMDGLRIEPGANGTGVLTLDGSPVQIAPESEDRAIIRTVAPLRAKVAAKQNLTAAEIQTALRFLLSRFR